MGSWKPVSRSRNAGRAGLGQVLRASPRWTGDRPQAPGRDGRAGRSDRRAQRAAGGGAGDRSDRFAWMSRVMRAVDRGPEVGPSLSVPARAWPPALAALPRICPALLPGCWPSSRPLACSLEQLWFSTAPCGHSTSRRLWARSRRWPRPLSRARPSPARTGRRHRHRQAPWLGRRGCRQRKLLSGTGEQFVFVDTAQHKQKLEAFRRAWRPRHTAPPQRACTCRPSPDSCRTA